MSPVSYVRAGVSCIPMIGPFIALYNVIEVKNELSNPLLDSVANMKLAAIRMKGALAGLSGKSESLDEALRDIDVEKKKLQNRYISPTQKGRIYAFCGVIGNVLSAITTFAVHSLAAIGIFSRRHAIFLGISFTVHAVLHGYLCYQHNKNLNALQNLQKA